MIGQYYFLVSALPRLYLDVTPEYTYEEVREMIQLNVTHGDWEKTQLFMRYIDLLNLRPFWLEKSLDHKGMLKEKEIEEALLMEDVYPRYLFSFLKKGGKEYRLKYFPYLLAQFFREEEQKGRLVGELFGFERQVQLIVTTLRCLHYKRDLAYELQYEDPHEFFIEELLSLKDIDSYEPSYPYGPLKTIFKQYVGQPKILFRKLVDFRFEKIETMMEKYGFSIDYLIGYLYMYILVEDWQRYDEKKGKQIVDALL